MLKFVGKGSAFNTALGNNGAYIKKDNALFLIDCGSVTFDRLKEKGILDDVEEITVLLTHTHPDRVGSLGDLIFYSYYSMGDMGVPKITIYAPKDLYIDKLLQMMGVENELYYLHEMNDISTHIRVLSIKMIVEPVRVQHVKELNCYGYVISYEDETAYYSGDSNDIPRHILKWHNEGEFDYFYQDTSGLDYEGNVHLSFNKLEGLITVFRQRVYCMHLDPAFDEQAALDVGFNVVQSI